MTPSPSFALGAMDEIGFIEDIGVPRRTIAAPTVALSVAKSGRTTGITTGTIGAVNATVSVQYQQSCAMARTFFVSYVNQVVINSSPFSAGGDSGSLIVTNDGGRNPVGLLYAGSSTTTIANPIGEVLDGIGAALGNTISLAGSRGGRPRGDRARNSLAAATRQIGSSEERIWFATTAMTQLEGNLLSRAGVIGIGVSGLDDNPAEPAIVIFVDVTT